MVLNRLIDPKTLLDFHLMNLSISEKSIDQRVEKWIKKNALDIEEKVKKFYQNNFEVRHEQHYYGPWDFLAFFSSCSYQLSVMGY